MQFPIHFRSSRWMRAAVIAWLAALPLSPVMAQLESAYQPSKSGRCEVLTETYQEPGRNPIALQLIRGEVSPANPQTTLLVGTIVAENQLVGFIAVRTLDATGRADLSLYAAPYEAMRAQGLMPAAAYDPIRQTFVRSNPDAKFSLVLNEIRRNGTERLRALAWAETSDQLWYSSNSADPYQPGIFNPRINDFVVRYLIHFGYFTNDDFGLRAASVLYATVPLA